MPKPNRNANKVWIELEPPTSKEFAEEQCALANRMMERLGDMHDEKFFYSEHERLYCWGGPMGYLSLPDNGHWFNLDYLGRD